MKFDFIAADDFRVSLDADYRELRACIDAGAWKAALVIAGSIVEALLVDYLIASAYQEKKGTDPLTMTLNDIVAACRSEGILSSRTADLCSVVRSYRNLIHPGRAVRLGDVADEANARIADSLVAVIVNEVAKARRAAFGLTAEQILSKLERDSASLAILPHLLQSAAEHEKEKLLLGVLPRAYIETDARDDDDYENWQANRALMSRYKEAYRLTFDLAHPSSRTKAVARFAQIVREEAGLIVQSHGSAFFRGSDIQYASAQDADLICEHVLGRMKDGISVETLEMATSVESFLDLKHLVSWIDSLVRALVAKNTDERVRASLTSFIVQASARLAAPKRAKLLTRLKDWIRHFDGRNQPDFRDAVIALEIALLPDDLPF